MKLIFYFDVVLCFQWNNTEVAYGKNEIGKREYALHFICKYFRMFDDQRRTAIVIEHEKRETGYDAQTNIK